NGLYARPDGSASIYLYVAKYLVQRAVLTPALARRKIFVVGEAERMVPQASSQEAANAFLKLLEEPPANTTLILTSSEPGALLPTIRSRSVCVRVAPLTESDVRAFLADPIVASRLDFSGDSAASELVRLAAGAPGKLIAREAWEAALRQARRLLEAAQSPDRGTHMRVALAQGGS